MHLILPILYLIFGMAIGLFVLDLYQGYPLFLIIFFLLGQGAAIGSLVISGWLFSRKHSLKLDFINLVLPVILFYAFPVTATGIPLIFLAAKSFGWLTAAYAFSFLFYGGFLWYFLRILKNYPVNR